MDVNSYKQVILDQKKEKKRNKFIGLNIQT
jgi:hypothetical protein